ncbi:hypothetical protein [Caulobacter vibrioides]|uniref:Uncharacterized protein n=1 Tax=Caulobacter phage S2B TaxID=2759120 RepID=A0AAE7ML56_9CAUD|nr:hypothetical protein [Caulobacter vibrioides]QOC54158.1 hypothetical protein [Caulobacter phage S2B]QXZ53890.1 hypothetical protein KZH45_09555 [Caulobacter vibrioides]
MRDNQGRELIRDASPMRQLFADAVARRLMAGLPETDTQATVVAALRRPVTKKVPAWRVTKRGSK